MVTHTHTHTHAKNKVPVLRAWLVAQAAPLSTRLRHDDSMQSLSLSLSHASIAHPWHGHHDVRAWRRWRPRSISPYLPTSRAPAPPSSGQLLMHGTAPSFDQIAASTSDVSTRLPRHKAAWCTHTQARSASRAHVCLICSHITPSPFARQRHPRVQASSSEPFNTREQPPASSARQYQHVNPESAAT
jgi:hypothetical protein